MLPEYVNGARIASAEMIKGIIRAAVNHGDSVSIDAKNGNNKRARVPHSAMNRQRQVHVSPKRFECRICPPKM